MAENTPEFSVAPALLQRVVAAHQKAGNGVSLSDFIAELLVAGLERHESVIYQPHDEQKIKERLAALGYIE
jgi:hypothetical protein